MAVLFHWVCITLVMYFSLKRVLNCHIIKLVKVRERSENAELDDYC